MTRTPGDRKAFSAPSLEHPGAYLERPLTSESRDRRFLQSLYIDLAGRTPLPQESQWALGKRRDLVIGTLVGSPAFFEWFYEEQLFYFLLVDNLRPSTDRLTNVPQYLRQGKLSAKDAIRAIVSSQFFNSANPGNDTFVTVVLEQLLGMTVQKNVRTLEAGKRMYDGYPTRFLGEKGASQADLVRITLSHPDFESYLLDRQFRVVFGAELEKKRLKADARRLREEPKVYPELVQSWVSSLAYETMLETPRPKSDRVFVRSLFVDVLGRLPTYQEFRRCRNALLALSDSRPLRSVVIKMMLDSGAGGFDEKTSKDSSQFVRDAFLRFLRREPSAEEAQAFSTVMQSPGCTRKTVVRALLTHPEYQHY